MALIGSIGAMPHRYERYSAKPLPMLACRISTRIAFRNTLVRLGEEVCKTPEQFKAWSQNLGHEKVLTTFLCYGGVACQRQGEIIRDLAIPQQAAQPDFNELAEAIVLKIRSIV